jgi:hypothetical protein
LGALISSVGRPIAGAAAVAGAAGAAGAGCADSSAAGAVGDGLAACGKGTGVGLATGVGRACTLGLLCGTGGVGVGGGGAIDCRAAGAATGAGLNSSAVIVRDSSGCTAGSLRTVRIDMDSGDCGGCLDGAGMGTDGGRRREAGRNGGRGTHVSATERRRYRDYDKATSCSEYQQRNAQCGHETNQQFHLELLYGVSGSWLVTCTGLLTAVD